MLSIGQLDMGPLGDFNMISQLLFQIEQSALKGRFLVIGPNSHEFGYSDSPRCPQSLSNQELQVPDALGYTIPR